VTKSTRSNSSVTLAAFLAVFGVTAPLISTSPSLRAERLGDDPAPGVLHHRHLESSRTSCRKATVSSSFTGEFAELEEEETDDEDKAHPPAVTFGDLLRLLGSTHPSDAPRHREPPALPPDRLLLLGGHLVC
jgi:hypothetical protein